MEELETKKRPTGLFGHVHFKWCEYRFGDLWFIDVDWSRIFICIRNEGCEVGRDQYNRKAY